MADGRCFTVLHENNLPSRAETAVWSPDKDLIAICLEDGHVEVHRLNWQRLWTIQPKHKVTSICWSPDSKLMAAGYSDGSITLHDAENGDVIHEQTWHHFSIKCLTWTMDNARRPTSRREPYKDRTSNFFVASPPPPPGHGSAAQNLLDNTDMKKRQRQAATLESPQLSVLCSADESGEICLAAFGTFLIGRIPLQVSLLESQTWAGPNSQHSNLEFQELDFLQMALSADLERLTVVAEHQEPLDTPLAAMEDEELNGSHLLGLHAFVLDTSVLNQRQLELRHLAQQAWAIGQLLKTAQSSLEAMEGYWHEAMAGFTEKMRSFSSLLLDHGSFIAPRDEFLSLLSCGTASSALHQFLASSLGEQGIKKLMKSMDAAGIHIHSLLTQYLQPSLEEIAFRLGELRGRARWLDRFGATGLEQSQVEATIEQAGMSIVQSERVLRLSSSLVSQFRNFFLWLTRSLRQLNDDPRQNDEKVAPVDASLLSVFLQTHFDSDPIGLHFAPTSKREVLDVSEEELRPVRLLASLGGFTDITFLQRTLRHHVESLSSLCGAIFDGPLDAITSAVRPIIGVQLSEGEPLFREAMPTAVEYKMISGNPLKVFVAFGCGHGSHSSTVGVMMCDIQNEGSEGRIYVSNIEMPSGHTLQHLSFYKDMDLALLLQETSNDTTAPKHGCLLALMSCELLDFQAIPLSHAAEMNIIGRCQENNWREPLDLESSRVRRLTLPGIEKLAVSVTRELACVMTNRRKVLVLDLADDEDVLGEEDENEE